MPCNLYGLNDRYDVIGGHVFPSFIAKFSDAKRNDTKELILWGSGKPLREFLCSDDLAEGVLLALQLDNPPDLMNIGSGVETSIAELARAVKKVVGYEGEIIWNTRVPDGTPRKLMDSSLFKSLTGWEAKISLEDGIKLAYEDYLHLKYAKMMVEKLFD